MINVAMVVAGHKPVAMETKCHSRELQMFALSSQSSLNISHLTQKPAVGIVNIYRLFCRGEALV